MSSGCQGSCIRMAWHKYMNEHVKYLQYIEDNWNTNTPEQKEATLKKIPAGRRGTSEEIAAGILFMASEEASYVTGHCLDINGGSLMM